MSPRDSMQPSRRRAPIPRPEAENESQTGGSGSSPPSKPHWEESLCGGSYQHEPGPSKNPSGTLDGNVKAHGREFCKVLEKKIMILMMVACFTLATVAKLAVQSYPLLQENKQNTISRLLSEAVRLLNDTNTQRSFIPPRAFRPDDRIVLVNQLYFSSMVLSLFALMTGAFYLQRTFAFYRVPAWEAPQEALALRQLRFKKMVGWGVHRAPKLLLFMVLVSIGLFIIGLIM